ncbi:MAG: pyruvate formate lyase family protein [Armatimonadota bacterium]
MSVGVAVRPDFAKATESLRRAILAEAAAFDERSVWAAESFRETEGEPYRILRVARATAHILGHMPVLIRRGELLVGWHPNTRADEELRSRIDEANAYLRTQNYWVSASEGHLAPDYPTILSEGLEGTRRRVLELQARIEPTDPDGPEKRAFYEAATISLEAFQAFIRRYARAAAQMADDEPDLAWAAELREIARVCERIATEPPASLREAIQLTWFVFLAVAVENGTSHGCFGPGRLDQNLWPFYEREKEEGTLDDALLDVLLDQFFIKCNEFAGPSMSAVIMVVGGRKPDGTDATNALSYKMLEASDRTRTYFPGVDVCWHRDMPEEFMRRACRLLRNGNGQPSFFNSDLIVRGLMRYGIPREHAVDHLPSTCTETSIQGRTNPWVAWPYVNVPMCLLYALFDGKHPITGSQDRPATGLPQTYEELEDGFFAQLDFAARQAIATGLRDQLLESWYRPFPLLSCFIQDCLERGKDISHGGATYNFLQPEAVGISNVVDGLAAAKFLVKKEGRFTLDDFRAAIRADWDGYEDLRRAILREPRKYGNNDPCVNDLFAAVAGAWCSAIEGHSNRFGGPIFPGFLGWTVWIQFGRDTPATPDGRKAGTPLAHSLAPCTGVALNGVASMLMSARGFDQSRGLGGTTFNVRFSPNSIATDEGVERLRALIEAAFDVGTYQIQINLAGADVMRAAQEDPEQHKDLLVRIGGYLVPFTLLPSDAQEDVIARAELEL